MSYLFQKCFTQTPQKAYVLVMKELFYPLSKAQRFCDKARVIKLLNPVSKDFLTSEEASKYCAKICKKNEVIQGEFYILIYKCNSRDEKPIFQNDDFAVFNKKSGVLSHPNGRNCDYSLNDEIWNLFGEGASVAHRLDAATSGLILVGKNPKSTKELKELFAKNLVHKEYLCLVKGQIYDDFCVSKRLKNDEILTNKMKISPDGKSAKSEFKVLKTYDDCTFLRAFLYTGRQHQLRIHLAFCQHPILGDSVYGVDTQTAADILDKKIIDYTHLTGATRLCLHSARLKFIYKNEEFDFKNDEILNTFLGAKNGNS